MDFVNKNHPKVKFVDNITLNGISLSLSGIRVVELDHFRKDL